jgi:hypothetical protein
MTRAPEPPLPARHIELRHVGPEDAALPVLRIVEARSVSSTGGQIAVDAATFDQLCGVIARQPPEPLQPVVRFGVFEARLGGCAKPVPSPARISPETFLLLMAAARQVQTPHKLLPDTAERIDAMVRRSH